MLTTDDQFSDAVDEQPLEDAAEAATAREGAEAEVSLFDDRIKAVGEVKPIALNWLNNAVLILDAARNAASGAPTDARGQIGLETARRHFHTDRRSRTASEAEAIAEIGKNFQAMRGFLATGDSIFAYVDDETASQNTRGYFGSEFTVAAYAYPRKSVSFTRDFAGLGLNCRAAVLVHQLAHYIDGRIKDFLGALGPAYDGSDYETAVFNVHSYPNFAINATPPFHDVRYGMQRPEV